MKRSDARNLESVFPTTIYGMARIPQGKGLYTYPTLKPETLLLLKRMKLGRNDKNAVILKLYIWVEVLGST